MTNRNILVVRLVKIAKLSIILNNLDKKVCLRKLFMSFDIPYVKHQ